MTAPVYVIAEAGVNHNGDLALARKLIDVAAQAGADAVKFQTFRADQLVSRHAPKAQYQMRTTGEGESQLEMIRRLELSADAHAELIAHARARGVTFLSTPFDLPSLELLTHRFGIGTIKIPSGEVTNAPFLLAIARCAERVLMSTGMSTLAEVEAALGVLAFGFTTPVTEAAGPAAFARAFASAAGQDALHQRVTLLHCTSEYPAPPDQVNLRAMETLQRAFGLPTGYSDHTLGLHISLAAVACGARVIEKHFTLDRTLPGPDHSASLEPSELQKLVRQIRDIEAARGSGTKYPGSAEWKNRDVVRKSLVAAAPIKAGELFTEHNVVCKRPGTGPSPFAYWQILGTRATRNYEPDEVLDVSLHA